MSSGFLGLRWTHGNAWRGRTLAVAAVFAAVIAYDLWRMPIQVSDSLVELLDAQRSDSVASSFAGSVAGVAYLRPLRIAQIKAVFDLANGRYWLAFRGLHVALVVALFLLFASALPITSGRDFAAAVFALTVLTGLHTFLGLVREGFPINHFLQIAVYCLAALWLARSQGGWLIDLGAGVVFAAAALTLESGLLVWVVTCTAWACGLRGVSTRGLALSTTLLLGYLALRFGYLDTGVPSLAERSSGFLLERLEPDVLEARFGAAPLPFYAYNVAASFLSVVVSEPRAGVFVAVREWLDGEVFPRTYVAVCSSIATTALIAVWAIARYRRRGPLTPSDRLAIVAGVVLVANCVLSFAYTKDEIVAVAGVFYAFAAFAAARGAIEWVALVRGPAGVAALSMLLLVLASAWAVRTASVDHVLRWQAFRVRNDWAGVVFQFSRENRMPTDARAVALIEGLRNQALEASVPNPYLLPEWNNRWFGD